MKTSKSIRFLALASTVAVLLGASAKSRAQSIYVSDTASIYEVEEGTGVAVPGFTPINFGVSTPTSIAISGNSLYVTLEWWPTQEYNATTGAAIANFTCSVGGNLAISNGDLYVSSYNFPFGGEVGVYDATTGAAINPSLISTGGGAIAVSGNDLYLANGDSVDEFNATNGAAIAQFTCPGVTSLAVSNGYLYDDYWDSSTGRNEVGVYDATTGAAINPSFITPDTTDEFSSPGGIAILGNNLYVASNYAVPGWAETQIGEFNATTGAAINSSLWSSEFDGSGSGGTGAIAVSTVPVPEPSTWAMLIAGAGALVAFRRRRS